MGSSINQTQDSNTTMNTSFSWDQILNKGSVYILNLYNTKYFAIFTFQGQVGFLHNYQPDHPIFTHPCRTPSVIKK